MFLVETLLNLVIYVISAVKTQTEAPFLIYYYICHQHRFSIRCLFVLISHHFKSLILVFVRKKKTCKSYSRDIALPAMEIAVQCSLVQEWLNLTFKNQFLFCFFFFFRLVMMSAGAQLISSGWRAMLHQKFDLNARRLKLLVRLWTFL